MKDILVSVFMLAYNHENFICEALDGVLMQKTDFRFEIIIHDDASTDRTAQIIRQYEKKYPEIIVPIYQTENQFSKGVRPARDLMPKLMRGKYIALCEGDDYWTDELKLQKQIDFLEAHPDYSMTIHNAWKYDMVLDTKTVLNTFPHSGSYPLEDQVLAGLGSRFPATASYVMRAEYWDKIPADLVDGMVGDYPIRVFYASKGNVYYFEEPMSVYRFSSVGSFTQRMHQNKEVYMRYIVEMGRLYFRLNEYLNYEFNDVYQRKIKSDYLGLATAVGDSLHSADELSEAFEDVAVDKALIQKCLDIVEPKTLKRSWTDFARKYKKLYLYGTSRLAERICQKLNYHKVEFEGFIVSDGYEKPDLFCDKPTYYLGEIIRKKENVGIILSVQPINEADIFKNIQPCDYLECLRISEEL